MAQRKQVSWAELKVGLLVLGGLFLIVVTVFYVTGEGALRPKYRLKTYLSEVEGLTLGAPVRLDGVEVGNVDAIRMNPQTDDRTRSIEVALRIDRRYQNNIRTDSVASLITEGLLGNRYVTIKRGFTGTPIQPGQELKGVEEKAIKAIVERGAEVAQNLTVLTEHINAIVTRLERGEGTAGKFLKDEEFYNRVNSVVTRADQIVAQTQAGQGTLGKLFVTEELYKRFDSAANRVDSILADVQAQKGSFGRFVYDPTLYDQSKQFVERGNALVGDIRAGKGTLGKLATEEALYADLRQAAANINSATEKLNQGQGTAGKFFTDPQFYDNMTGLAGDLRLLIGEFRQNPKKFLRVKFSLF